MVKLLLKHWLFVLTKSLLSRFAFLRDEVTELASFSAIHALNIFTANDAEIPENDVKTKTHLEKLRFFVM